MKTKEVKATKIAAKKETKEMTKNLFYIINVLNKCAKKQTSPTGCKLENVAKIVSEANRITGKGITFAVLPQNSSGVVCRLRKVTPKNYNGGEIVSKYLGEYEYIPVANTFAGVLDAVTSYLQYRADVEKDLQAAKKEKRLKKADVFQMLKSGEIDETTFIKLFETAA